MQKYGQFCPISKAMEVLGERWSLLIIRELLLGAERFSELQYGLPKLSPTMLNRRLGELVDFGIVQKKPSGSGRGHSYSLTPAGLELQSVLMALGEWGMRWARGPMAEDELDVYQLMQDIRRNLITSELPDHGRCIIHFQFQDLEDYADWWLKIDQCGVDLCTQVPSDEEQLLVQSDLRSMIEIWMGDLSISSAKRNDRLKLIGAPRFERSIGQWLGLHQLAHVRPARTKRNFAQG